MIELAENLSKQSQSPQLMLWVAWLVIKADRKISDDEALLIGISSEWSGNIIK